MESKPRRNRSGNGRDSRPLDGSRLGGGLPIESLGPRRSRLSPSLGGRLAKWLRRVVRVHAHLCNVVRLYSVARASGDGTNEWRARAMAGDQTILCDAVILAVNELEAVRGEIETEMDSATPTSAPPGSAEKVEAMRARVMLFQSLFVSGDMEALKDRRAVQGR